MTRPEFDPAHDANSRQDAQIQRCACGQLVYGCGVCRACAEAPAGVAA